MSGKIDPTSAMLEYMKTTKLDEAKAKKGAEPFFRAGKELTPEEKQVNEKKAIEMLKKDGYKITPNDDGTYTLKDNLGHLSKITNLGLNERGGVRFTELTVNIIAPSQRERYERNVLGGGEDSAKDKAKYAKEAMDIAKKAGYKIEEQGNGKFILTNPDGAKSLVTDFDIAYDGGAIWTTLPLNLEGNKPKVLFEEY